MAAHTLPGLGLSGNFVDGQDDWGELMDANLERLTIAVNTRVLGTVANSGALPADPADGDMWLQLSDNHIRSYDEADDEWMDTTPQNGWRLFREDTLDFYNFIDGAWVAEDSGPSLPEGGTTGQVLAKASNTDGDAEWVDPEAASLPGGGTVGQVLTKTADGAAWGDVDALPAGGTTGQVLVKASGTDGDAVWADPEAASEGGVWAVVNAANGATLAGDGCTVVRDTVSRYTVTFDEPRPDANYGVLFGGTSGAGDTMPYIVDGSQTVNGFSIICYNNGGGEASPGRLMFQLAGLLPGAEGGGGAPEPVLYRFGSFFTTEPDNGEVLMAHPVTDAITLPANFAGSRVAKLASGVNPGVNIDLTVKVGATTLGTITLYANGTVGMATAGGTAKAVAAGDVIELIAPANSENAAGWAWTFRGEHA